MIGILALQGNFSSHIQILNKLGYDGENPWDSWANSSEGKNGEILSGWRLRNSNKPARIPEKHSETAFMTNRAIAVSYTHLTLPTSDLV